MELLVYSIKQRGQAEQLMCAIETVISGEVIRTYDSVQSLSLRLCQPGPPPEVTVLLASTRKDLSEILSIRDLLSDLRLILLLPDKREDTVSEGHSLYRRFHSYAAGNFGDAAAVLKRMI
jgi:hypothetical protein